MQFSPQNHSVVDHQTQMMQSKSLPRPNTQVDKTPSMEALYILQMQCLHQPWD